MRLFLLLLALAPSVVFGAEKLHPLSESVSRMETEGGGIEPTEIAYVGIRCAALYVTISGYLEQGARNDDTKETAKKFADMGKDYWAVAVNFSEICQMSDEAISQQFKAIAEAYTNEMLKGKSLNNAAYTDVIAKDQEAAKGIYATFHTIAEQTKQQK